jgi:hypothetical protein
MVKTGTPKFARLITLEASPRNSNLRPSPRGKLRVSAKLMFGAPVPQCWTRPRFPNVPAAGA